MTDDHGERLAKIETKIDTLIGTVEKFTNGEGFARCATRKAQIANLVNDHTKIENRLSWHERLFIGTGLMGILGGLIIRYLV